MWEPGSPLDPLWDVLLAHQRLRSREDQPGAEPVLPPFLTQAAPFSFTPPRPRAHTECPVEFEFQLF